MLRMKYVSVFLISLLWLPSAFSKRFANQFTQFELPTGWQCAIEGSEWVCQSENKERRKEAIIILAAKFRGQQDSLEDYQAYLKGTKTYQLPGGKMQRSEPKYVKTKSINEQQWVDALHLASEVPGFYTRYLATVKEDLGVAVTFSVTKDLYSAYQGVFDNVVASLRVFRQKKQPLGSIGNSGDAPGGVGGGEIVFDPVPDIGGAAVTRTRSKSGEGGDNTLYMVLAAVGAGLLLLKLKGGKKKKKKTKKKK